MLSLHWLRARDVFIKLKVLEANGDLWLVIPKAILRRCASSKETDSD